MSEEIETTEEELENGLQEEVEQEESGEENAEEVLDGESEEYEGEEKEESQTVASFDDEEPDRNNPDWVKNLRKQYRETAKRNRELEKRLAEKEGDKKIKLRGKPSLEGHDYDGESYEKDLDAWYEEKREHDKAQESKHAEEEEVKERAAALYSTYSNGKADYDEDQFNEAEEAVISTLSIEQQNMILQTADNSASFVFTLANSPQKLQELSEIKNPARFIKEVAKLEMKMGSPVSKKAPPAPEKKVKGGAPVVNATERKLEKAREKAQKTGDFSEVVRLKKQLRANA